MLDFTLHVHETLLALTLHVWACFKDLLVVCIVEFTGHLLSDRDTISSIGMGAGVNGNKTRLNIGLGMGMGMGMNHWEWEGMGLKNIFPLISSMTTNRTLLHLIRQLTKITLHRTKQTSRPQI